MSIVLPIEARMLHRCEAKGCRDYVEHMIIKVDLQREPDGVIVDYIVRQHYVCEAHYIPLAVDIAGQATNGEIFG